ncbi:hypothetical protein QNM99_13010 [Pseudomonas sp. PCH446]
MIIRSIEIIRLSIPFSAGTTERKNLGPARDDDVFNAASPRHRRMESLMLKVTTDTGLSGWGEAFGHGANPVTFRALTEVVAPMFIGTALADRVQSLEVARRALHGFGSTGPMVYALSGIDIALWDLAAQVAGQPCISCWAARRASLSCMPAWSVMAAIPTKCLLRSSAPSSRALPRSNCMKPPMRPSRRPVRRCLCRSAS